MHHDVLAATNLLHTLNALYQSIDPLGFLRRDGYRCLHQAGHTLEDSLTLDQAVSLQSGARRYQVADEFCPTQAGCDFNSTGKLDDRGVDIVACQIVFYDAWVAGRNSLTVKLGS